MNIEKADYCAIISLGTMDEFYQKMKIEKKTIKDIVNEKDSYDGSSLLECCISSSKNRMDIALELLENNANVNVITNNGNEFHYLAWRMDFDGAIKVGYKLLEKGASLNIQDKQYKNTGFFTLCHCAFIKKREKDIKFLEDCLKTGNVDLDVKNVAGFTPRVVIMERGTDSLRELIKNM